MWTNGVLLLSMVLAAGSILLGDEPVTDTRILTLSQSPYLVKDEWVVEPSGSLVIEAGVVLNFHPGSGLTVKGSLVAKVATQLLLFDAFFLKNETGNWIVGNDWRADWKLHWNLLETGLKLLWNDWFISQWNCCWMVLRWLWNTLRNCSETALKLLICIAVKLFLNGSKIALKMLWNCTRIIL